MGYIYGHDGRLACDYCGATGGVRKHRCPFGWCQAYAACPACRKKHARHFTKATHRARGCEQKHLELEAERERERELLAAGEAARCSALQAGEGRVHVLFKRADGTTTGFYMSQPTYRSLPLVEPFTPDDYRQHGELEAAPPTFHGGATTKQIV